MDDGAPVLWLVADGLPVVLSVGKDVPFALGLGKPELAVMMMVDGPAGRVMEAGRSDGRTEDGRMDVTLTTGVFSWRGRLAAVVAARRVDARVMRVSCIMLELVVVI